MPHPMTAPVDREEVEREMHHLRWRRWRNLVAGYLMLGSDGERAFKDAEIDRARAAALSDQLAKMKEGG